MSHPADQARMDHASTELLHQMQQEASVLRPDSVVVNEKDAAWQPDATVSTYQISVSSDPIAPQHKSAAIQELEASLMKIPSIASHFTRQTHTASAQEVRTALAEVMNAEGMDAQQQQRFLQWQGLENTADALQVQTHSGAGGSIAVLSMQFDEKSATYAPQIIEELQGREAALQEGLARHLTKLHDAKGEPYVALQEMLTMSDPQLVYHADAQKMQLEVSFDGGNPLADIPDRVREGAMCDALTDISPTLHALAARPEQVREELYAQLSDHNVLAPILQQSQFTPLATRLPFPDVQVQDIEVKDEAGEVQPRSRLSVTLELPYHLAPSDITKDIIARNQEYAIPQTIIRDMVPPIRMMEAGQAAMIL